MKTLRDMKLLANQVEEISMMELRRGPGDIIEQTRMGKTFYIFKAGRMVAVLSPPEPTAFQLGAAARQVEKEDALRGGESESP